MKKHSPALLGIVFCILLGYLIYMLNIMDTQSGFFIRDGWQYRWGDSPVAADGKPTWAVEKNENGEWRDFSFPSQPPGWDGASVLWLRGRLPDTRYEHPVLFMVFVRQHLECWVDGRSVYHYGEIPVPAGDRYNPWFPWHMVLLPEDSAGKEVYLRVHSIGPTIGIAHFPRLSSLNDLLTTRIKMDFIKNAVTALCFFIGVVALAVAMYRRNLQSYYALAGCAFCNGIVVLSTTFALSRLFESDQFVLLLVMVGSSFGQGFWLWFLESGVETNCCRIVRKARYIAFGIAAAGLLLVLQDSSQVTRILNVLFLLLLINLSLMMYVFRGQLVVNRDAQIYAFGSIVWAIAMGIDALRSAGVVMLTTPISAFGQFIDIACLIAIVSRRVAALYFQREQDAKLIRENNERLNQMNTMVNQMNNQLEKTVAARTQELTETTILLQEKVQKLDMMEKARKHLLSNIAHDLRTPITMIGGHVEAIIDGVAKEPEQQQKSLRIVHAKILQLNRRIEDVFTLSRLESRSLILKKQKVRSGDLLQEIASCYEADILGAGIHLVHAAGANSQDCIIDIDPGRMDQVFANLIYNALRYTPRGGKIILSAMYRNGMDEVILSVRDNGSGIAAAELERIFQRFYVGDDVPYETGSGTGLGLAIAREIVEMHGGRIWAESVIDQGSVFHIALPARQGNLAVMSVSG